MCRLGACRQGLRRDRGGRARGPTAKLSNSKRGDAERLAVGVWKTGKGWDSAIGQEACAGSPRKPFKAASNSARSLGGTKRACLGSIVRTGRCSLVVRNCRLTLSAFEVRRLRLEYRQIRFFDEIREEITVLTREF